MWSRGFYREAMKGILQDSIRLRPDKSENLRIQNNIRSKREHWGMIKERVSLLSQEKLRPYFDIVELEKAIKNIEDDKQASSLIPHVRLNKLLEKYILQ
jgi:hypothetical protein